MFYQMINKRLVGEAIWSLFGQFGSAIALLAGTRIITELVSPDIYGQVAILNGIIALGITLFAYPFICAGMRLMPEHTNKRERSELYRVVATITFRVTIMTLASLLLGGGVYAYLTQSDYWLFIVSGLLLMATVRRELGIQLLIGERRQREASLWQTTDSILRPVLAIFLLWLGGAKAVLILLGYALASFAISITWTWAHGANIGMTKWHHPSHSRNLAGQVWGYAMPLIPMELLFWINGLGDRYVIGYMMTATDVGLYAATYTLINEAFNRSAMVFLRIFQPVYFQHISTKLIRNSFNILWAWIICILMLGILGVITLYYTKDMVVNLLLSDNYRSAAVLMPAIGLGCAVHALGTVFSQPLLASKRTRELLIGRILGVVMAAISIPFMVRHYGLLGAAMANPIYFSVETIALALLAKPWRMVGEKPNDTLDLALEKA